MHIEKTNQLKLNLIKFVGFICLTSFLNAQAQQVYEEKTSPINSSYLESKEELKDYILDTGDTLDIEFVNLPKSSSLYTVNEQGEIYFPRIKHAYVRGLTIKELNTLLKERYKEFLINPEIYINVYKYNKDDSNCSPNRP